LMYIIIHKDQAAMLTKNYLLAPKSIKNVIEHYKKYMWN